MSMTLVQANTIVDAALSEARVRHCKPMGVIVLDAGGHPVVYKRRTIPACSVSILHGPRLWAHWYGRRHTRARDPCGFQSAILPGTRCDHRRCDRTIAGGVMVRDAAGEIVGAVGVSGDTPDADEACAFARITAAGLNHGERK